MNNDLISREVALNGIDKNIANLRHHAGNNCVANSAINLVQYTRDFLAALPAVDAVEVVRCRDCEHWKPSGSKAGNSFLDMEYIGGCEFTKYYRSESDYCSYGERKE